MEAFLATIEDSLLLFQLSDIFTVCYISHYPGKISLLFFCSEFESALIASVFISEGSLIFPSHVASAAFAGIREALGICRTNVAFPCHFN